MIRHSLFLATCLTLTTASLTSAQADRPPDKTRIVTIAITPAPEPDPALKYLLLPPVRDQIPGNAQGMLMMATQLIENVDCPDDLSDALHTWVEMEVEDLPKDDIRKVLDLYRDGLHYTRLAGRHEWCEWDFPIRSEGFSALLPSLSRFRTLGRLLAVEARVAICEGRFDDALSSLQTGYALARHVGDGPTIINNLVGVALASLMTRQLELWSATPGSPNLYWAITRLPRPFANAARSFEYERNLLYLSYPKLLDLRSRPLTRAECDKFLEQLAEIQLLSSGEESAGPTWHDRLTIAAVVTAVYPKAQAYLESLGHTPEQIDAMPAMQVVMIYNLDRFNHWRDELFKWLGLPYWQASEQLDRFEDTLGEIRSDLAEGIPFISLLPSLSRAHFILNKVDCELAAMQCVEAFRMQLADHGPATSPTDWDDHSRLPLPIDPITGQPFRLEVTDTGIVLDARVPDEPTCRDGFEYRITIAR